MVTRAKKNNAADAIDDAFEDPVPSQAPEAVAAENESRKPEIKKSGQMSGNPENQKSGNLEATEGTITTVATNDYLGAVYGGITDPYDDFTKGSTQLPLCVWRTLKAAAPMEGVSVQQLLTDIILGRTKPLPKSHPELLQRFYDMAQQGKLKR